MELSWEIIMSMANGKFILVKSEKRIKKSYIVNFKIQMAG